MDANKKNAFENNNFILIEDIYRNTVLYSFAQQNKNKCHMTILRGEKSSVWLTVKRGLA